MSAAKKLPECGPHEIKVSDLTVEIVRKDIKNIHLGVYPPNGHVRVATPLRVDDEAIRLFTIARLPWIRTQQRRFQAQERQSPREYVSGESHYFQGRRYRLQVIERPGPAEVRIKSRTIIQLCLPAGRSQDQRAEVMNEWYRAQLKAVLPDLVKTWSERLGVKEPTWGVKAMRTKWGSCNREAGRIWINLELAKHPLQNLEYVVVHELTHLIERHHSNRFRALLDQYLPGWQQIRASLTDLPTIYS